MSGVKSGTAPAAPIAATLAVGAVGVAGAGFIALGAAGGAIITGVGAITREVLDRIDAYTEDLIQQENARLDEEVRRTRSDLKALLDSQQDFKPDLSRLSKLAAASEERAARQCRLIIDALNQAKQGREVVEEKRGLERVISKKIEQQIKEYTAKEAELKRQAQIKREAALQERSDNDAQLRHLRIRELIEAIRTWYPDVCEKVEAELDRWTAHGILNVQNLDKLHRLHRLDTLEKSVRSHLDKYRALEEINAVYKKKVRHLDEREYQEFLQVLAAAKTRIEQDLNVDEQTAALQVLLAKHEENSAKRERVAQHEMHRRQAREALVKFGYTSIRETHNNRSRILVGENGNGRKATVSLALPGVVDENLDPVRTEIDQTSYTASQEEEFHAAGKELVRQLESQGMIIDFAEACIEFHGQWAIRAEEVLTEHAKKSGYTEEQIASIKRIDDCRISVNGRYFQCPTSTDVKAFLKTAFEHRGSTQRTKGSERQKERA